MREDVCLIVPVKDEADNLPWLLPALVSQYRTIVVDNDSRDASAEVARGAGAELVRCPERGVGRSIVTALSYLRDTGRRQALPRVVAIVDADGSFVADDLTEFLRPILDGEQHIVFSRIMPLSSDSMPLARRIGQAIGRTLMRLIVGFDPSPYGTLVAADYDALRSLELEDQTWGWLTELRVKATLLGLRTLIVDVPYHRRQFGRSKITGSLTIAPRAAIRILWATFYYWLKSRSLLKSLHWSRSTPP